jgi:5-methylcytosine-specific restriction endonuclease McrA
MHEDRTRAPSPRGQAKASDPEYGPACPSCGGIKAKQAWKCMPCRKAAALTRAENWQAFYAANKDRLNAKTSERLRSLDAETRARYRAREAQWRKDNPERVRATWQFAKRRRRGLDEASEAYAAVLYGDPCSYCGSPTRHVDHVEPLSRGGDNHWTNLTGACAACNHAKSATPMLHFMLTREIKKCAF